MAGLGLGLCGAQRVGKSTLAQAFAQQQGAFYLATNASGVYAALGMDPKLTYPVEDRLKVQREILRVFTRQYEQASKSATVFIADRTPFDLAAYMMADIERQTLAGKPELAAQVNDYIEDCLKVASRFFAVCVLVQPGIEVVEGQGKAPGCPAYMEHINSLQLGLLTDDRNMVRRYMIPREVLDLDARIAALVNAVSSAISTHQRILERDCPVIH